MFIKVRPSCATVLGALGEVLGEPLDQRQLAHQVGLGVGQTASILFDQAQAVACLGQRLAKTRHGGKLSDQGVKQLQGVTIVLLGLFEITQLFMDPAAEVESQCQLVADLTVTGVGRVGFFEYGNCLVIDNLGRLELAVQSEKVGLALEGLSQA